MKLDRFRDPMTGDEVFRFVVAREVLYLKPGELEMFEREAGHPMGGAILFLAAVYQRARDREKANQPTTRPAAGTAQAGQPLDLFWIEPRPERKPRDR